MTSVVLCLMLYWSLGFFAVVTVYGDMPLTEGDSVPALATAYLLLVFLWPLFFIQDALDAFFAALKAMGPDDAMEPEDL